MRRLLAAVAVSALALAGTPAARAASTTARQRLQRALGPQGVVQVDRRTGTPRLLARLDGTLSGPARGDAAALAMRYVRRERSSLGLDSADLGSLRPASRVTAPGGLTVLRWTQSYRGIPVVDGDLRVAVARDGRVLSVWGSPRHAPAVPSTTPTLSAPQALRRVGAGVGGSAAQLVLLGDGTGPRLAWHVTHERDSGAWFDAVVDAGTGAILRRLDLVKRVSNASVWENYPGAPAGGTPHTADLAPYLTSTTMLSGPNAHQWADVNDDDAASASEETTPGNHPFADFTASNADGACDATHRCSWDSDTASSWTTNRAQNGTQAFYFVNRFHDHLAAPPIGFTPASGNFEGADRVLVQTDDGAAALDADHVDNADFATPPDGRSPRMQMYLFLNDPPDSPFRDVNGGDDASVVYHEYTHGLSSRLVTDGAGVEALNTGQAGAMGEAWSDWYAKDFLADEGLQADTPAPGDVDMGQYVDAAPHSIRSQGLDCPVGAAASNCPGTRFAGPGGYTYGDFGRIAVNPSTGQPQAEVHADGEIWSETLWDLRSALGSPVAEAIVTGGLRLSPPEPSFVEERDAILLADRGLFGGAHVGQIWQVFAHRGMGFFAGSANSRVANPHEDFSLPPVPAGTLSATPSAARVGQPVTFNAVFGATAATIASYRWDFDGNGTVDAATAQPAVSHAYGVAGRFAPRVFVSDSNAGTGVATTAVTVSRPSVRPGLRPAHSGRRSIAFRVSCDSRCRVTGKLTVSRAVARRLHLRSRTVGRRTRTVAAGTRRLTLKLSRAAARALRRSRLRSFKAALAVSARDAEGQTRRARATVRIRR